MIQALSDRKGEHKKGWLSVAGLEEKTKGGRQHRHTKSQRTWVEDEKLGIYIYTLQWGRGGCQVNAGVDEWKSGRRNQVSHAHAAQTVKQDTQTQNTKGRGNTRRRTRQQEVLHPITVISSQLWF